MRFWTSWYTTDDSHDFPVEYWITGETMAWDDEPVEFTCCAVVEAESEEAAYALVQQYAPDFRERFCEQVADDWQPGSRFQQA